ncbi:MAG: hypothetical protein ACRC41_12165 [Sarcina sp.]
MSLNELTDTTDNPEDETKRIEESSEARKHKEEIIRKLANEILDSNPQIVEEFNNGEINSIEEVASILKNELEFEVSDEAINNIVGEQILNR